MNHDQTTLAIQGYLNELAGIDGESPAEPLVRKLLARSVDRLHLLCGALLFRSYPRLTRPPVNLQPDEMLSAVVERLIKAMREVRPGNVRQFFALATRHMRWELNDLTRRLDERSQAIELREEFVPAPQSSGSVLGAGALRMLDAIENLPEDEREVFDLVRIQGMTQHDVAQLLSVSIKTVQRRLNHGLLLLSERLSDLRPPEKVGNPVDHEADA